MTCAGWCRIVAGVGMLLIAACSGATQPRLDSRSAATIDALTGQLEQAQSTLVAISEAAEPVVSADDATAPEPEGTARGPFPTRTPRPLTAADAAPCQIGEIKGNRSSKIYHVPGGGSYAQTKANVQCFATEADAQSAGYRRALN